MKAFFSVILAFALSISTVLAKHGGRGGHRGHGGYKAKHGKHFSSLSPRGGRKFSRGGAKFSRAKSGRYRNWSGRNWRGRNWSGGYWGGGDRFIFTGGYGYPYYWLLPSWGWSVPYAYTAIILTSIIRMTVAPYQEGNSMGPDPVMRFALRMFVGALRTR